MDFPQYTLGFHWLLKARCGYRLDSKVLKVANLVESSYPDKCPCCKSNNSIQNIEHWLMQCSSFRDFRSKHLENLDNIFSFFNCSNIDNHNVNGGNSGNIANNDSNNVSLGENNSINSLRENNNGVNENLSVNNSVNICSKVFNFLLGGKCSNENINNKTEWGNMCKCQLKPGAYSEIPFLAKTAAFFNSIMPIVFGQQWSLFNKHKKPNTKSANAEQTVRQASRARVNIRIYAHATERNRNSSLASQTQ